jgi:hypothetical protein
MIQSLTQVGLEHAAHVQVQLMDCIIPALTSRPADQRKMLKGKQRLMGEVELELAKLLRWLGGNYLGFDLLPVNLQQQAQSVKEAEPWSAGALLSCMCIAVDNAPIHLQHLR